MALEVTLVPSAGSGLVEFTAFVDRNQSVSKRRSKAIVLSKATSYVAKRLAIQSKSCVIQNTLMQICTKKRKQSKAGFGSRSNLGSIYVDQFGSRRY